MTIDDMETRVARLTEKIRLGDDAATLVNSTKFREYVRTVRDARIKELLATPINDLDKRNILTLRINVMDDIAKEIAADMANGQIARQQLKELQNG